MLSGYCTCTGRSASVSLDVKEHGCPPDFITVQCYPHEDFSQDSDFFYFTSKQTSMPSVLSKDKNFTLHFLRG